MELVVIIVAALVGFWLFLFVLKRVLRMALRLAVIGALLLALLVGALAWWWYEPFGGRSSNSNRNAPARQSRNSR
jgi:hypothetical protein